jgi:hypothetical protein
MTILMWVVVAIVAVVGIVGAIVLFVNAFDVETGNDDNATYILFDDDNGKRHIIYYTTGTICIDEN